MAKISQIGPGRKTSGTIDGITYVTRGDVTYARTLPKQPSRMFNTPEAKKRQAIFKFAHMHMMYHLGTIKKTIDPEGFFSSSNHYYKLNGKALSAALSSLAERYIAGEDVTITDIEAAISSYAAEHPTSITIAAKSGYDKVFLTGEWPNKIVLKAQTADSSTTIIIVNGNGVQTIINADGTVSTGSDTGSNEQGANGASGSSEQGTNGSGESGEGGNTSGDPGTTNPSEPQVGEGDEG